MFATRYYAADYFAPRYFPKVGAGPFFDPDYFLHNYFAGRYFPERYFPGDSHVLVTPAPEPEIASVTGFHPLRARRPIPGTVDLVLAAYLYRATGRYLPPRLAGSVDLREEIAALLRYLGEIRGAQVLAEATLALDVAGVVRWSGDVQSPRRTPRLSPDDDADLLEHYLASLVGVDDGD